MFSEMKASRAYVQFYSTLCYNLSLLKRTASVRLERLGGASLCVDRVEVRSRKGGRVTGRVERVGCGGKALEVLAVVGVGLDAVSIRRIS